MTPSQGSIAGNAPEAQAQKLRMKMVAYFVKLFQDAGGFDLFFSVRPADT